MPGRDLGWRMPAASAPAEAPLAMNLKFLCTKLGLPVGCTWTVKTENPKVSWNTGKDLTQLHITAPESEPKVWLECLVCGKTKENPGPEELKKHS